MPDEMKPAVKGEVWSRMVAAADALRDECWEARLSLGESGHNSDVVDAALCISRTLQACTDALIHAMMAREEQP